MHIRSTLGILFVIVAAGAACLAVMVAILQPSFIPPEWFVWNKAAPVIVLPPEPPAPPEPSAKEIAQDKVQNLPNTLAENGELYTSKTHGFSLMVPKTAMVYGGDCVLDGGKAALIDSPVPIRVSEDASGVTILPEYWYETGENNDACTKVAMDANQPGVLTGTVFKGWKIESRAIANDTELEGWIQERYGKGCKLGEKIESPLPGVQDVQIVINPDLNAPPEEECLLNYSVSLKYIPAQKKALAWNLGQEAAFWSDWGAHNAYDLQMLASFRIP